MVVIGGGDAMSLSVTVHVFRVDGPLREEQKEITRISGKSSRTLPHASTCLFLVSMFARTQVRNVEHVNSSLRLRETQRVNIVENRDGC